MKGTITVPPESQERFRCFNPRTHEGYDMIVSVNNSIILCFNPRTHGGYDFISAYTPSRLSRFNPRTHGGYDGEII